MYRNFTEALRELFGIENSVLEIAPGTYVAPTISIIQKLRPEIYIAFDGAIDIEHSFEYFNQLGGLKEYVKSILDFFGLPLYNINPVCGLAHRLPLKSKSIHNVLFVKTLYKLVDGILDVWKKAKKSIIEEYEKRGIVNLKEDEYKKLAISTYEFLVLDEARRVGKNGIVIIPESSDIEKETLENLRIYSELTDNSLHVFSVRSPTWEIEKDGKLKEVGHWQDNSSRKLIYLEIWNSDLLSKEEILKYKAPIKFTNQ